MAKAMWIVMGIVLAAGVTLGAARARGGRAEAPQEVPQPPPPAVTLAFHELFEPGATTLRPSAAANALAGKRVRIVGFMAQMEEPSKGAFYLTPRPVQCDEGGGGTGDLPPESVRVVMSAARGAAVPFMPGALEAIGTLEVGNEADDDGRVSAFRLRLERPVEMPNKTEGSSR